MGDTQTFLAQFGRRKPTLAFIDRTGEARFKRITRRYATPRAGARGAEYFNEHGRCCYFVGNSHQLPRINQKGPTDIVAAPRKADIRLCVGVWIDVDNPDPDIADELIHRLDYQPTYVCFTGGGWQAHWRFSEATEDVFATEACALGLLREFADLPDLDRGCFTAEHLWRLPGTRNLKPDRHEAVSRITHADWQAKLPIDAIEPETPPAVLEIPPVSFSADWVTLEVLREAISPEAFRMLTRRPPHCPSRSEHQFAFIASVLNDSTGQERLDMCAACLLAPPLDEQSVSHGSYFNPDGTARDAERHVQRQITNWLRKNGGSDG
ncbi:MULTISPECIES: hypothetical protein [Henriciella]|jgi:hypothetical protein|uniref:hypothetical protein n=1 Tax=Henriciella TaxID=453849 RepID=UPI003519CE8E